MKNLCFIAIGACVIGLIVPANALAAKADGKKAKLMAKYDTNKNDVLDADEKKAMQDDYAKDKEGELKEFDKDGDGKLSEGECAAIKPGSGKTKGAASSGKAKRDDDDKSKGDKKGNADKGKTGDSEKPKDDADGKAKKEGDTGETK